VPLALCTSLTCQAGDYFFEPLLNTSQRYESNLFLRPVPLQDNWISTLSPGVNFGLRHDTGELKSNFTWNQLFYTNQSELNIAEQLFSIDYQHKTERLEWGTRGSFNHQSSINTLGTVTGLVFEQVMAKQLSLAPTLSYSLNELSSLSFDYSYNNTAYEKNNNPFSFSNYDYHQVSSTFNHLYTERDKLNVTLSGSRYKTAFRDFPTYNEVAQLGWQHSFTEKLVTYISAGINYSQTKTKFISIGTDNDGNPVYQNPVTGDLSLKPDLKSNNFGQVYQASIQKSFEKGSVSLVGSRNQTPTSQGLQTQTQLAINNAYTVNERWTSGLSASYSRYEVTAAQQNSQLNFLNRDYFTVSPNINWKWTPEINLALSYTFRHQEFQNSTQSNAQGNSVQLQFSYQPQINHQVK